ncbi:MAG TPA: DUF1178 family protein [Sphingomicrobium sp.]|nr:DUF1178 family protein [Sphingomicrobium sp.]
MIVFDLSCLDASCPGGETFEAWFRSGSDFESQHAQNLVECPFCRSTNIAKAPMAPRLPKKGAANPLARLAAAQAEMLRNSRWVGDRFTETARAMHSGDAAVEPVHGNATIEQAAALVEEGVPVAPLPLPVIPPGQVN